MSITRLCCSIDALEQGVATAHQNTKAAVLERDAARQELAELKGLAQAEKQQTQQRLTSLQAILQRLEGQACCHATPANAFQTTEHS